MDTDDADHRAADHGPGRSMSVTDPATGVRVVRAGATLDATAASELRREFDALLARSRRPLVVDLSAVRGVESDAASVVLRHLAYEAGDADVDLRVVRDPGAHDVARAVLGDETLFEVYPTLHAALGRPDGEASPPAPRAPEELPARRSGGSPDVPGPVRPRPHGPGPTERM